MIAGHFGLAAAVKAKSPQTPLWALMLATQWLDVVFAPLLACGIETFAPVAGAKPGAYGAVIIHAEYTHSFIGALLLACLFGAAAARRYGKQNGIVLGSVVMSHYVLDVLVHRADMPILPGATGALGSLGLGLWQYPTASAFVELVLVAVGAAAYWQTARRIAGADAEHKRVAYICSAAIGVAGVLTLGLNYIGM